MVGTSGAIACAMHMVDGLMLGADGKARHDAVLSSWDDGCVELYMELGSYAGICDKLFEDGFAANNCTAPGVYDYEVSCEFGSWFGDQIVAGHIPTHEEALAELSRLAEVFWGHMKNYYEETREELVWHN